MCASCGGALRLRAVECDPEIITLPGASTEPLPPPPALSYGHTPNAVTGQVPGPAPAPGQAFGPAAGVGVGVQGWPHSGAGNPVPPWQPDGQSAGPRWLPPGQQP